MYLGLLLLLIPAASASSVNDTLLWGAYRPNLYFGLRPQLPQSLMTGLMWFGTHDYASFQRQFASHHPKVLCLLNEQTDPRHACEQNDKLDSYTWTHYDARQGGVQVIKDSFNNVKLTTEFLKIAGGDHGGSWAARIKGEPIDPGIVQLLMNASIINHYTEKPSQISTVFYFGLEGLGGLEMETEEDENVRPFL